MISSQAVISKKLHSPDYKEKYKTELCRNWLSGFCSYDNKCVFAHGNEELREKEILLSMNGKGEKLKELECTEEDQEESKKRLPVFVELSNRLSKETDF